MAAFEQARLTRQSLKLTREVTEVGKRAWLVVRGIEGPTLAVDGQRSEFKILVQNVGESPAIRIRVRAAGGKMGVPFSAPPPNWESMDTQFSGSAVIGPGNVHPRSVFLSKPPETTMRSVRTGEAYLFWYGEIEYEDIFHRPRRTRFAWQWNLNTGGFEICDSYNGLK